MEVEKKISVAGMWTKKVAYAGEDGVALEPDIKQGDSIELLNAGTVVSGTYGDQTVFSVKTRNGEKNQGMNQTSMNTLIEAFGGTTEAWVGKMVKVHLIKSMVKGKMTDVVYIAPEGWEMNEDGEFAPVLAGQDIPFEG